MINRDEIAKLLEEADGCFEAALAEGWNEALADGNIDRIRDIYDRRISWAQYEICKALRSLESAEPVAWRYTGSTLSHGAHFTEDEPDESLREFWELLYRTPQPAKAQVPEGYALVEKSFIPEEAVQAGLSAMQLAGGTGCDQRTQVVAAFTDMVLKADVSDIVPLTAAPNSQQQAQVPEGWKLVPIHPTPEMREEATKAVGPYISMACWDAMLTAAPNPPQEEDDGS